MKSRCVNITLTLVMGSLALYGVAFAHGTEQHGKTTPADSQMIKLHGMMPMFSVASAGLEVALDRGEVAAIEAEAGRIIAAIPDLKKSQPHKNIKQRKKFIELATDLDNRVTTTVDLAKNGDFAGAKTAFKKVEKVCVACHAKFRD